MPQFKTLFSYYGSKAKIAAKYPKPKHGVIVEPFAGAANYSFTNFENDVFLVDLHNDIIKVWQFLINASEKDILGLPKFYAGLDLRTLGLSQGEKLFCGFWANRGAASSRNIVSKYAVGNTNGEMYFEYIKQFVAENLYRIRHFQIKQGCYQQLDPECNYKATWFIDPPYQNGGQHYVHNQIDYEQLKIWIEKRTGFIIVCENDTATWLQGKPLFVTVGARKLTKEIIWNFDNG
jgi:16S rRNA G966 N2-methylase RsmD